MHDILLKIIIITLIITSSLELLAMLPFSTFNEQIWSVLSK